jgi:hypothetical protein
MYAYFKKKKRCYHLINPETHKTYCKMEHSSFGKHLIFSNQLDGPRSLCMNCEAIRSHQVYGMNDQEEHMRSMQ